MIDSPFDQWRLKYMKGTEWRLKYMKNTAASREIRELLALAFEGGRVAEREVCAKLCDNEASQSSSDHEAGGMYWCAEAIRARSEPSPAFKNYMGDNWAGIV